MSYNPRDTRQETIIAVINAYSKEMIKPFTNSCSYMWLNHESGEINAYVYYLGFAMRS